MKFSMSDLIKGAHIADEKGEIAIIAWSLSHPKAPEFIAKVSRAIEESGLPHELTRKPITDEMQTLAEALAGIEMPPRGSSIEISSDIVIVAVELARSILELKPKTVPVADADRSQRWHGDSGFIPYAVKGE
jgi:hypothetical protein